MAGHSKWANIKHRKDRADKQKGKIFSRISKEIITAVKLGGSDPKNNPRLRIVLQKAKENNVPNDNVDRNIKKGLSQDQANYEDVSYELYGHGGIGIIVEGMTDNRNRFASEMRIATNKRGGHFANPGAVAFNFDRKGILLIKKDDLSEEKLF
jgi:YebC/PmpR family DNA-binding regulatory protein